TLGPATGFFAAYAQVTPTYQNITLQLGPKVAVNSFDDFAYVAKFNPFGIGGSCVDGPRLARDNFACRTEVACSHVSGLFMQSGWTAGPDGVRQPRPHHSSGIDVPMNRQASLGCVGTTDCAITRHYSLASSSVGARAKPPSR